MLKQIKEAFFFARWAVISGGGCGSKEHRNSEIWVGASLQNLPFFFPKRDGAAGQVPSDGSWLPQTNILCPYISWQRSPCAARPVQMMLKPAGDQSLRGAVTCTAAPCPKIWKLHRAGIDLPESPFAFFFLFLLSEDKCEACLDAGCSKPSPEAERERFLSGELSVVPLT